MIRVAAATMVAAALATGCTNDGPDADVQRASRARVSIESLRCARPNVAHGQGVIVGDNLVVTAGHLVEGDLRSLTIDGHPATVVTLDRNSDLAVLTADLPATSPVSLSASRSTELVLLEPDGQQAISVTSRESLVIEHATDRATYRRDVIAFTPSVREGTSGAPVVDEQGRLAAIVILDDEDTGEGLAVVAGEVSKLLDQVSDDFTSEPIGRC